MLNKRLLACAAVLTFLTSALASPTQRLTKSRPATTRNNNSPPANAILDLNGTPIPGGGNTTYQQYSVTFTATLANTAITFAFREDPAFLYFSNPSIVDTTANSGNLFTNGNFSGPTYTSSGNSQTPVGWTYVNVYGATFGGVLMTGCGAGPTGAFGTGNCWYDGAVQAYDALSQTIQTTPGHSYKITYWLADNDGCEIDGGPPCNFSQLSTNGDVSDTRGNGIDMLVYTGAALPTPAALRIELAVDTAGANQGMLALATAANTSGNNVNMQTAAQGVGFDHLNFLQIILTDLQLAACAANTALGGCSSDFTITGKVPTLPTYDPPGGGYALRVNDHSPDFSRAGFLAHVLGRILRAGTQTQFYTANPGFARIPSEYRAGTTLAAQGATAAPGTALGFSFSDQPNTTFIVPGTAATKESITFVTALVGVTGSCNLLISTNCGFQIIPGTTFKWSSANGTVAFTPTPGGPLARSISRHPFSIAPVTAKTPDNFPGNVVDLTGPQLVNAIISVDEFLALAGLTPASLASVGGSVSIFSGSLTPSEEQALINATQAVPLPNGNVCNGTYIGPFNGNINVSAGQNCSFVGGQIIGNVQLNGGIFALAGTTVTGNVQLNNGGSVSVGPGSVIEGNLQIQNVPAGGTMSQVCGATVHGDLQFQNNGVSLMVGSSSSACAGNTIGGNLTIQNNTATANAIGNSVANNLTVQGNTAATMVNGNSVHGNLQDQNNTAPTTVFSNVVGNNLQCQQNTSITGGSNTAGQKQGQCASF